MQFVVFLLDPALQVDAFLRACDEASEAMQEHIFALRRLALRIFV